MALILNLDTATSICSVCLAQDGNVLSIAEEAAANSHSTVITQLIEEVLKKGSYTLDNINAIGLSEGPGSYTGLRIGASIAKGLCYSLDIPLVPIPTLTSMAAGIISSNEQFDFDFVCPMIDARRMEVYYEIFNPSLKSIEGPDPLVLNEDSFSGLLSNNKILFFGTGSEKFNNICSASNAAFTNNYKHSAASMTILSWQKFSMNKLEDMSYFTPRYLKNFYTK